MAGVNDYRLFILSEINTRACGGMVDTLVLGTSAQAWEFESLHAQIKPQWINSIEA